MNIIQRHTYGAILSSKEFGVRKVFYAMLPTKEFDKLTIGRRYPCEIKDWAIYIDSGNKILDFYIPN